MAAESMERPDRHLQHAGDQRPVHDHLPGHRAVALPARARGGRGGVHDRSRRSPSTTSTPWWPTAPWWTRRRCSGLLLARARLDRVGRPRGGERRHCPATPRSTSRGWTSSGAARRAPWPPTAVTWRPTRPSSARRGAGAHIDEATPDVVAAYVASLRRTRSGATVARSLSTLRGFHRFLVEEGEAPFDPTADIPGVAVADLLPKALSEDETGRLLGRGGGHRAGHAARPGPARAALRHRGAGQRGGRPQPGRRGRGGRRRRPPADPGPRQGEQGTGGPAGAPGAGRPPAVAVRRGAAPPRAQEVEAGAATPRRSSSTSAGAGSPGWGRSAWSRSTPAGSAWPTG